MTSVGQAVDLVTSRLLQAGVESARLDARILLAEATGMNTTAIFSHPERELDAAAMAKLETMARQRQDRQPLAHIVGHREFWSLDFQVGPATLIPRPDSETLIEAVLARVGDRKAPLRLLDLGTGSGCLLLALLSELPLASGIGVDRSEEALQIARANAERLGLKPRSGFVRGDWAAGINGLFDIIVCNPPYIPDADIAGLEPEVRDFEPLAALSGGRDGLESYRRAVPQAAGLLAPGGIAAFEIGLGQEIEVSMILQGLHMQSIEIIDDLSKTPRVVLGLGEKAAFFR